MVFCWMSLSVSRLYLYNSLEMFLVRKLFGFSSDSSDNSPSNSSDHLPPSSSDHLPPSSSDHLPPSSSDHLLVAAFDFGTTYSGYAFSFRDDPLKIQTNAGWNAATEKLISLKTPTCVLVTPNKEFHSFGYEAENNYANLAENEQHHGWLLFRRFKMLLHNNENLTRKTTLKDINGVSMPAITVFSMSIRYLRGHLLDSLEKQATGVNDGDIKYVLTVPAIWNDNAKQFMREAAVEAGIDGSHLKLALEPEAASVWCQIVTTDAKEALSKAGTQYMIVDLGGGTADISVQENQFDNKLRELHKASGGPWGGTVVDQNFIEWLTKLFGLSTITQFKKQQMEDYFDLLREFETKKRTIRSDTTGKITFRVSAAIRKIYNDFERGSLEEKLYNLGLCDKVTHTGDKLRVDASIVKEWFAAPVNALISHVKDILAEPKMRNVKIILLVGGFSESLLVQEELKKNIQFHRIIIPYESGLVVLKGAVRFGHNPDIVSSRIMSSTYGISVYESFNENKHPVSKMVIKNKEKLIAKKFEIFVRSGEEINVGQEIHRRGFTKVDRQSTDVHVPVYRTSNREPEYVTDEGCKLLGLMTISHPDGNTTEDTKFDVTFIFGDTELSVKVKNVKTGHEFTTYIDCLE